MPKVAVIEKYPSRANYKELFDCEFERYSLVNSNLKKVLKKDVTLDKDFTDYDFVVLVGAEVAKHVAKITGIIKYQGYLLDNKWLPLANPLMLKMKPEGKPAFDNAVNNINNYIKGSVVSNSKLDIEGLQNTEKINAYLKSVLNDPTITHIAMDTETTALYPRDGYLLGVSITHTENQGIYLDSDFFNDRTIELLQLLCDTKIIVFHNAKFDMKFAMYHLGITFSNIEDTLLLHYCLDETVGTHSLKNLAIKYTKLGDYDRELEIFKKDYCSLHGILKRDFTYDLIPFETMWPYAAIDTLATFELFHLFKPKVENSKKLNNVYNKLLIRGTKFLNTIEENGVPFDKAKLIQTEQDINTEIEILEKKLYSFDEVHRLEATQGKPFNPGSTDQLIDLFFTLLGLEPTGIMTDGGKHSTNAEALELLAEKHPIVEVIHKIRKIIKIKNTYITKVLLGLDKDNRLRTGFNLSTTTSGRLSSSGKLNMQQLPRDDKRVKDCITAREGYKIVSQDLGTAEMYCVAVLSGDKVLQQIFIDKQDYHGSMAVQKFGLSCTPNEVASLFPELRQEAKTVSFEILYKLNYNEPALKNFKVLKRWLKTNDKFIRDNAFIYSFFGRKRRLKNVFSDTQSIVNHEVRSGINFLVQSIASDINLLAAMEMQDYIEKHNMKAKIFALVHDSILAEVPDEEIEEYSRVLKQITQQDFGCSIPGTPIKVDLEIGQTYAFKETT